MLSKKEFSIATPDEDIYLEIPSVGIVKANIYSLNDENKTVTVHRFRSSNHTPLKRKMFRIDAQDDIDIEIFSDGLKSDGVVIDINEKYIAFRLERKRSLTEGSIATIDIKLPTDETMELFSSEVSVEKIEKIQEAYKIVVLCNFDIPNKNLLQHYISNRQMEIIKELKDNNQSFQQIRL